MIQVQLSAATALERSALHLSTDKVRQADLSPTAEPCKKEASRPDLRGAKFRSLETVSSYKGSESFPSF